MTDLPQMRNVRQIFCYCMCFGAATALLSVRADMHEADVAGQCYNECGLWTFLTELKENPTYNLVAEGQTVEYTCSAREAFLLHS